MLKALLQGKRQEELGQTQVPQLERMTVVIGEEGSREEERGREWAFG